MKYKLITGVLFVGLMTPSVIFGENDKLLELGVNHIALTIMPTEEAIYLIEVTRKDLSSHPTFFSIENPDVNVESNFSPTSLIGSGIVKLSVSAVNVSNDFNQFPIEVLAQTDSAGVAIERRIRTELFVVSPPADQSMITLAFKPDISLNNGTIQPFEGRIVPYESSEGDVRLRLVGPDNVAQEVVLSVDSLGMFSYNRVFRQPGPWQATVDWVNVSNPLFVNPNSIFFEVSRRTPKIVVTTRNGRNTSIGNMLSIVGQVAIDTLPPESSNKQVRIQVVKPPISVPSVSFDTTMFAMTDSKGRFNASYRVKKTGEHRIVASVMAEPGGNSLGDAPCALNATTTSNVGSSSKHLAIIIIGGSDGLNAPFLDKQNRIAAFVYAKLNKRNFNRGDVLILGQSDCIEGFLTRDEPACAYTTKIAEFLSSKGVLSNKHLFVYLIGKVVQQGAAVKAFKIFHDPEDKATCPADLIISFQNLAIDLTSGAFSSLEKVTYVAEFDYGGRFLNKLDDRIGVAGKATDIASTDAFHPVNLDTWVAPEMSFSGKFMNQIRAGRTIDFAFYQAYSLFPQLPNLDDNGPIEQAKPNGVFSDRNDPTQDLAGVDGKFSVRGIGSDPGSVDVDLEAELDTEASPAGVLLKDLATILVSIDNFNSFEIETISATIYPPPNSNLAVLRLPLKLSPASDLYKSSLVSFFESGTYTIEVNISYSDGLRQRFSSFLFKKRRSMHPDGNQPPIRNIGT